MPRPSSNPDKARQSGGGGPVEAGVYEITGAKYQNRKTDFKENQPTLVLTTVPCDSEGNRAREADEVEIYFGLGGKSMEFFHPGQGKSIDDADPADVGTEVDAEGNTIFSKTETEELSKGTAYNVFVETLTRNGFPKSVLDKSWAPSFVGMKFELAVMTPIEINKLHDLRLSERAPKGGGQITYKVVKSWLNKNYLSGGSGAAKTETAAPVVLSVDDAARKVFELLAVERKGKPIKNAASLNGFMSSVFAKGKLGDKAKLEAVKERIKDKDFLTEIVAEAGGSVDGDVITFE